MARKRDPLELNKREKDILKFIETELNENGYPPSVREIGKAVGLSSTATVHGYLAKLEEKGYITRFVDMKNNRLVRKMGVTEKGKEVYDSITDKLRAAIDKMNAIPGRKNISSKEKELLRDILKRFRDNLSKMVDMQI